MIFTEDQIARILNMFWIDKLQDQEKRRSRKPFKDLSNVVGLEFKYNEQEPSFKMGMKKEPSFGAFDC